MKHNDILTLIGCTPLVRINHLVSDSDAEVWAKLEGCNPGASVKDRIAIAMIEAAEKEGALKKGGTIVEPTSGNTGIGLAMVATIKGYKTILTMPETMTLERRQMLKAYGAELVLTEGKRGMAGALQKAEDILRKNPHYFMPHQFENPANPEIHRKTTAVEIIDALGDVPDAFVAGVGTGGTITGCGEVFKSKKPETFVVAVEPSASPVLSGGDPGPHKIAGIGAGFAPGILNTKIYDEIITVTEEDAGHITRELSLREGIFCGISSGAAMWAALKTATKTGKGNRVVAILPDRGERYLSTGLFEG